MSSDSSHAEMAAHRSRRRGEPFPFPSGVFGVALIDPPWTYYDKRAPYNGAHDHYPAMSDAEIAALPVKRLLDKDGVAFVWATGPRLDAAIDVIRHWGLSYRGVAFVWEKLNRKGELLGATGPKPTTTKPVTEFVLVAARRSRGRPRPLADQTVRQVIQAQRGRHSEKPVEVMERLERMYPDARKIELFARSERLGWTAWGNEVASHAKVRPTRAREVRPDYGSVKEALREALRNGEWRAMAEIRPLLPTCSEGAPYRALEALEREGEVEREEGSSPRRWRLGGSS